MSKIGRYEVEAEIGRGAMGVVYLARDPRLQRRVAIKTYRLPAGLTTEQKRELQERFLREAQAAACLSHPGIVTVFDTAEDEATGDPFIAMEFVQGRSLREWLDADGNLAPQRCFEIAGILAGALHVAHAAGIVHRDLKPGNVLVREADGQVKIADFGVARLPTSELTRTGATLGSPAYMSPEQIRGRELDARSDLFSLAVILYETLCGERPFMGEELAGLAYAIVHENPLPMTKRVSGLPRAVDEFFDRALAKDPDERFSDGNEFAAALRAAQAAPLEASHDSTVVQAAVPVVVPALESPVPRLPAEPQAQEGPLVAPQEEEDGPPQPGMGPAHPTERGWDEKDRKRGSRRWLTAAVVVVMLLFGARWLWGGQAYLELQGKSNVRSGTLTLTVDGREVYNRELAATGPKGVRFLKKAVGIGEENFNKSIGVSAGKHEIVAYLESTDDGTEHRERVVVEMERGEHRKLRLSAGSGYGSPLSLKVD